MSDAKAGDEDGIQVAEVTELLDDGMQQSEEDPDTSTPLLAADVADQPPTPGRISSQREVIRLLSQFGQPSVAVPNSSRAYGRKKALKKLSNVCLVSKLKPLRPTKTCKRYMHERIPYRDPVISFASVRIKLLPQKRLKSARTREPEPDVAALPISFDDYLTQMDSFYKLFLVSENAPDDGQSDSDLDVSNVKKYKSQLLSGINTRLIKQIMETKTTATDVQCSMSQSPQGRNAYFLEMEASQSDPFKVGLKVRVEVEDEELFGDVISVLHLEDKVRLTVTLKRETGEECQPVTCSVRPVALVGHLMLQARALFTMEQFRLHSQFLDPVVNSLSSGIVPKFSEGFMARYAMVARNQSNFYADSIQKIIDTVALNQADVSRICVVDDYDLSMLSELFLDTLKYLYSNEDAIVDQLREVTELRGFGEDSTDLKSLTLVIVSESKDSTRDAIAVLDDLGVESYCMGTKDSDLERFLKKSRNPQHQEMLTLVRQEDRSVAHEEAKRSAREAFLHSCPVLIGSLQDLLNDEFICRMLQSKSRIFDAAIVLDASTFTDAELMSLLLFGINKLICLTVTAKQAGNTVADRMIRMAIASGEIDARSPVLDRAAYKQRDEQMREQEMERQRAAHRHAHSYRETFRGAVDIRTREGYQNQAQRSQTHFRPQPPRGRGSEWSAGRGRGHDGRGGAAGRGRGAGAYQSLHDASQRGRRF